MNALAVRLAPLALRAGAALLVALAIVAGWFYVSGLRAELAATHDDASRKAATIREREATIAQMQGREREHARALVKLAEKQKGVAAQLAQSAHDFETLKNENPDVRAWADSPLPDDIVRMYDQPAFTGAGYVADAAMRAGDAVRSAGDGAAH